MLAYGRGGALETVLDGKTGLFFYEQVTDSLMECIQSFEENGVDYSRIEIREHSFSFAEERFRNEIRCVCEQAI